MSLSIIKSYFKAIHVNIKVINNLLAKFLDKSDQILESKEEALINFKENTLMNWGSFYQDPFKMKCLLSPLIIHIMKITLRENSKLIFLHIIKSLKKKKKNLYSSRENNKWNQNISHHNTFKIKWLLSLLNLYLLKTNLILNSRPGLNNQNNN